MNKYIFTGNLTKDCRTAYTPNGKAVCNFTVAVSDGYGDNEHTEFVDCAMFGKRAEGALPEYLTKGQKVCISGRPRIKKREYKGEHYANINVFVEELELIGSPKGKQQSAPQQDAGPAPDCVPGFDDDDICF